MKASCDMLFKKIRKKVEEINLVSKLLVLQKYEKENKGEEKLPTLVKLKPEAQEEKKADISNLDDTVIDDPRAKIDYVERPWRQKLNPAAAVDKKNQKFHHQKLDPKASICSPYSDKHDVLVEHLALTVQVRKDIIQSILPLLPKFPRDKSSSLKLLDLITALTEGSEKLVFDRLAKPQDVFVLPSY